ncbi:MULTISPECIES: PPC domain-containing DNA-binding protein [unclassified Vibrio]|uniref:PPC domain-containing DNA-binding protein n=1 Tax=unclassified Vibrio TaxID=2614977 RepID=UPI001361B9AA|nr:MULTISPECIES: PPC domain-containing DNA-binding protein [unclassified Vibrio]NAW58305.1 DUF296 domain-containing protein [Vibrio sp. V36_P2S2PM302]NAX27840.1 DUF296 domain-containing protein [Vibrio sp. V38_P2S17PM301]NAX29433.1 DUF296 domain-containing protein [Vibrio sp. V37_P2S8PM304]
MSDIKAYAIRLTRGDDLKQAIQHLVVQRHIQAGSIASCVGSLSQLHVRLAGAEQNMRRCESYEIVSLMGTLTPQHQHLHISVSDVNGQVWGGHVLDGCLIDTTAELIIHYYPDYVFDREDDKTTGYSELSIKNVSSPQ